MFQGVARCLGKACKQMVFLPLPPFQKSLLFPAPHSNLVCGGLLPFVLQVFIDLVASLHGGDCSLFPYRMKAHENWKLCSHLSAIECLHNMLTFAVLRDEVDDFKYV